MPAEEMLKKYAEVAVSVGLGVEKGDRVLLLSPIQLPEFTRMLVETAYEAGAVSVDLLWKDQAAEKARFTHGSAAASDAVSGTSHFRLLAYEMGASYLNVFAEDPAGMAGADTSKIRRFQKANGEYLEPEMAGRGALEVPWCIISAPVPGWNNTVFPDSDPEAATERMWEAIFRSCRIDRDDPVGAWRDHLSELNRRKKHLSERAFSLLRYEGPGTDLVLGLPDGAKWEGGGVSTPEGRPFVPNLPTEEVFTSPHREKGDGHIAATKPLSYFGDLIEGFTFEVSDGRVVSSSANKNAELLEQILATDDGAVRFGEAAMVPQSGAVAAEKLVWNNALYDENDACHIALGQSYSSCLEGASSMTKEEQSEAGLNQSTVHVDFVVGSPELSVFGVLDDGQEEPIISKGEWAFEV